MLPLVLAPLIYAPLAPEMNAEHLHTSLPQLDLSLVSLRLSLGLGLGLRFAFGLSCMIRLVVLQMVTIGFTLEW